MRSETSASGSGGSAVPGLTGSARQRPVVRLMLWCVGVGLFWIAVLPWLSKWPVHSRVLEEFDEKKINPAAMYYTEVEALEPVLERLNLDTQAFRPTRSVSE